MGRIVYAPCKLVKELFLNALLKKHPAYAVYHQVLNLQRQVGPYLETPPWLKPIALFLNKLRTLLICIGSKREGNITNTAGLTVLYHTRHDKGSERLMAHWELSQPKRFVCTHGAGKFRLCSINSSGKMCFYYFFHYALENAMLSNRLVDDGCGSFG